MLQSSSIKTFKECIVVAKFRQRYRVKCELKEYYTDEHFAIDGVLFFLKAAHLMYGLQMNGKIACVDGTEIKRG